MPTKRAEDVKVGDRVLLTELPSSRICTVSSVILELVGGLELITFMFKDGTNGPMLSPMQHVRVLEKDELQ